MVPGAVEALQAWLQEIPGGSKRYQVVTCAVVAWQTRSQEVPRGPSRFQEVPGGSGVNEIWQTIIIIIITVSGGLVHIKGALTFNDDGQRVQ